MLAFFIRRVIYAIIAMWAVSVISFVIINLPAGDFVTTYIATQLATGNLILEDEAESLREFYGLNDPGLRPVRKVDHAHTSRSTWLLVRVQGTCQNRFSE